MDDGFRLQRALISGELRNSLAALVFMRLVRLGHDLVDSGAFGGKVRRKLQLDGGGWMFLLFFAVMLAPLIALVRAEPNGGPGCAGDPQDFGGGFRGVGGEDSRTEI